jgi:hypothetical protein
MEANDIQLLFKTKLTRMMNALIFKSTGLEFPHGNKINSQ